MEKAKEWNLPVFLYVPNVVGYIRIALLLYGLLVIRKQPIVAGFCFFTTGVLDAVDGILARLLKQTSSFGAILDYSIDRLSVASYCIFLGSFYPQFTFVFCLTSSLDISSHFFHLKASLAQNKSSHKELSSADPLILRFYYNKWGMYATCLMHDLTLLFLYLYHFYPSPLLENALLIVLPGFLFKVMVHVVQLIRAAKTLLTHRPI
jgi:CDP-diacylglycerol--inositol 3-phosphatidyltransferase